MLLTYRVWVVTDTAVCAALPPEVRVTVVPLTEPTAPVTSRPPRGRGHWPFDDGTISTAAAVTAPLVALLSRVGRTVTQLPAVTSDSWADTSDEIFVEFAKSTVALPFWRVT